MQQQRLPITIGQKCERETDVSSERQYFRHSKTRIESEGKVQKDTLILGPSRALSREQLLGDTDS